jgi:hypothetical protein
MKFESRSGQNENFGNLKKHILFTALFGWSLDFSFEGLFVEL